MRRGIWQDLTLVYQVPNLTTRPTEKNDEHKMTVQPLQDCKPTWRMSFR
jgi:hypothetical protein